MTDTNEVRVERTIGTKHLEVSIADARRGEQATALAQRLRAHIRSGSLRSGTKLPASRSLALDLGVSRGVVVRAYEQLTAEGYLRARQGRGTEVGDVSRGPDPGPPMPTRPATNPGLPPGGLFPRAAWLRSATRALSALPDADLGYGDPAGHPLLRHELATYLGRARALIARPENIVVVNGFAQAGRLLADVLRASGITDVGVEDPGSAGLREQLTRAGLACQPVAVDTEGIRVDALSRAGLRAVFVTPAHQFPTGVVMSPGRRHALLAWARDHRALVVEDDYDAEYRYDRSPVGALQGLGPDVVVYGGSISKTLAPGMRLGWLVVPEQLVRAVTDAKYDVDLGTGVWEQVTLAEFLASGEMDRHIRRTSLRYRARRDRLVFELTAAHPEWEVTGTAAGLHLLVYLPAGSDEAGFADLAQRSGLDARPLRNYAQAGSDRPGLVIGYGHQPPDALADGVARMVRLEGRPFVGGTSRR